VLKVTGSRIRNSSVSATGPTSAVGEGGAIWLLGSGRLTRTSLTGNTVTIHSGNSNGTGGGGAAWVVAEAPFTVQSSMIDGNAVHGTGDSGLVSVTGGGAAAWGFSPFSVRGSTVSRNHLTSSSPSSQSEVLGGGLSFQGTNTDPGDLVINSTIAGNTAQAGGGSSSPDAAGGGIYADNKRLQLRFDTIVRNILTAAGSSAFSGGGGVYLEVGTTNTLGGNVIALNGGVTGKDCLGTATSDGFNLFSSMTGCSLSPTKPSDRTSSAPKLGSLAANGGPTLTVALLAGSPAIDRVPVAPCHAAVKVDQRGVLRPQGPRCDEGAFERQP
jgi:hypothetical protein